MLNNAVCASLVSKQVRLAEEVKSPSISFKAGGNQQEGDTTQHENRASWIW